MTRAIEPGGQVRVLGELLAATGCTDLETLAAVVDGDCEPDVWVAETGIGLEVSSGTRALVLEYPFTVAEFWSAVDAVEQEEIDHVENAG
jgi:hypothetical protein